MQKYANSFQDNFGNALASAAITVFNKGTAVKSTIYSDNGITQTANPITANSLGEFEFFAADGRYDLSISKTGVTTQTLNDILLFDPAASTGSAGVGFVQSGTGSIATDVQTAIRDFGYNPKRFGVTFDGTTNDTAAWVVALAAVPTGGFMYVPSGTTVATLRIRRSDITIFFDGTVIQQPAGASGICIELGDVASGNGAIAYEKINILGKVLLDGNKANVTAPSDDLTGWGFMANKISNSDFGDGIRAKNCHNGGVGIFINSNYNKGSFYVESCGNATHTAPGFDINSSKYGDYTFISKDCYDGGRILDNCFGLNVRGTVQNATSNGFTYDNQTVNESYCNNIDIAVVTCGGNGFIVGRNCRTSNIRATVISAAGVGMNFTNDASFHSSNLNIDLTTRSTGSQGLLLYGDDCTIRHQSYLDGRTGAQGAVYAVDVFGNRNKIILDLIDSATWQVRGINFRAGATDNNLVAYSFTNTADPLVDSGTTTRIHRQSGIDNTPIGATTKSTGAFTTLTTTGATALAATTCDNSTDGFVHTVKNASGTSDILRTKPQPAGTGPTTQAANNAGNAFANWNIEANSIRANCKIYPGTDAAAAQTAAGLYAGTGVPSNTNGANGDFYFRSDGGAGTSIYMRRAGAWVGIV